MCQVLTGVSKALPHLILIALCSRYHFPYFIGEETEAQRGRVTCSSSLAGLEFEPSQS